MFLEKFLSKETYDKLVKQCGEDLINQLAEKTKDFEIDASNEKLIPKAVLGNERQTIKDLRAEIATRDTQLTELGTKVKDNDVLTAEIQKLKDANKTASEEYEKKLAKQDYEYKLDSALTKAKVKNTKAVRALIDESKIKVEENKLVGFDEQLKALQESDPYLFSSEVDGGTGGVPGGIKDGPAKMGFDFSSIPEVIKQKD